MMNLLIDNAIAQVMIVLGRCIVEKQDRATFLKAVIKRLQEVLEDIENGEV